VTTDRPDDRDEALEEEIRALLTRFDTVPERVAERAREAASGGGPAGSSLLEIAYDSVLDESLGPFRPGEAVRLVSFAGVGLRLDLRLEGGPAATTLCGWTAPVRALTVALESERASTSLRVEPDGTFRARDVPHDRVRLHIAVDSRSTRRQFHSSWFVC
jgi:hypothetical protein